MPHAAWWAIGRVECPRGDPFDIGAVEAVAISPARRGQKAERFLWRRVFLGRVK